MARVIHDGEPAWLGLWQCPSCYRTVEYEIGDQDVKLDTNTYKHVRHVDPARYQPSMRSVRFLGLTLDREKPERYGPNTCSACGRTGMWIRPDDSKPMVYRRRA